jgi:tetratricopeptide (TPR) repeat protein
LRQLLRSPGVGPTSASEAGESKPDNLKEEEVIAAAASRFIREAEANPEDVAADRSYAQAYEQCDRLLAKNPRHLLGLQVWAHGRMSRAVRKPRAAADSLYREADSLYREAEEKLALALTLAPEDTNLMARLGHAQLPRAALDVDCKSDGKLAEARVLFETILRLRPSFGHVRILWAHALAEQSKRAPGPETDQALADALASFETAAAHNNDPAKLMRGHAAILFAQGLRVCGEESVSLLRQAKEQFLGSELREPGSGAYRAACVCARLGENEECRQWLKKSREPGVLIARDELAAESPFEPVRYTDWFQEALRPNYAIAEK